MSPVRDSPQIQSSALVSVAGRSMVAVARSTSVRVSLGPWDQAVSPALPPYYSLHEVIVKILG